MTLEYTLSFLKLDIGIKPIEREEVTEKIEVLGGCTYLVIETKTDNTSELLKKAKEYARGFVESSSPYSYVIQLNL